jgi:diacylglycerol kinase (ATP)
MGKPGHNGIRRVILATQFSAQGLAYAWKKESAFRQEVSLSLVMTPAAFWLGRTAVEILVLILPLALVLIVELLNSAIEATVDRISDKQHELAGSAKDMGSAAVFISLLVVAAVWATVAWQRFGLP